MHYTQIKTAKVADVVNLEAGEQLAWMAYNTIAPAETDNLEIWINKAAVAYIQEGNDYLYERDLIIGQHVLAKMLLQ